MKRRERKASEPTAKLAGPEGTRGDTDGTDETPRLLPPFVVGVGASAGGLEALRELVRALAPGSGLAWVVVTHQHPDAVTLLPEILQRSTECTVKELTGDSSPRPDTVYVCPPGSVVRIRDGEVSLSAEPDAQRPIDVFFRSLAEELGEDAVGVVLSGTGSDGTRGAVDIKTAGGLVLAQTPESAKFGGMPSSAVASGAVDTQLLPSEIPEAIARHFSRHSKELRELRKEAAGRALTHLLDAIRTRTGHDFTGYKKSTLLRRIDRRIAARGCATLRDYVKFAQENPGELDTLFREILISVTSFFRDEEAFECLTEELRRALKGRLDDPRPFRIWVAACATGEEAYSIAIVVRELAAELGRCPPIQIFATDLDADAIDTARSGRYPLTIANHVSPARLDRFFIKGESDYRINRETRELVVFAVQDLVKDPPFTKLDVLTCRNLLIYLEPELQRRVLGLFSHALNVSGVLVLGSSESLGRLDDVFETVDKKQKVFRRRELQVAPVAEFPEAPRTTGDRSAEPPKPRGGAAATALVHAAERVLLNHLAPPSVLVGPRGDILYFHGRTGLFLEPPSGEPVANVHGMAREGLRLELQAALRHAVGSKEPIVRRGLQVKSNDGFISVRLTVRPLEQPAPVKGSCIVTFEIEDPALVGGAKRGKHHPEEAEERMTDLEAELQHTRENLQGTIEELETSNEELKSTNEELQSTNEELQSANEELETSREEMQSLNEELQTVNSELEERNRALSQANDDMQNLLNSTEIATVFLDGALSIKRFTTPARKVFSLIDTDIGRPISDLTANLRYNGLVEDAREVLATLVFREREIQTREGAWRLMRLMPYRTAENVIDGLVITFVDIDRIRREERAAEAARVSGDDMIEQLADGVAVLDSELRVLQANRPFLNLFHTTQRRLIGEPIASALEIPWTVPALQSVLQQVAKDGRPVKHVAMEWQALNSERHTIRVSAHRFAASLGGEVRILLTVETPDPPEGARTDGQPVP